MDDFVFFLFCVCWLKLFTELGLGLLFCVLESVLLFALLLLVKYIHVCS